MNIDVKDPIFNNEEDREKLIELIYKVEAATNKNICILTSNPSCKDLKYYLGYKVYYINTIDEDKMYLLPYDNKNI